MSLAATQRSWGSTCPLAERHLSQVAAQAGRAEEIQRGPPAGTAPARARRGRAGSPRWRGVLPGRRGPRPRPPRRRALPRSRSGRAAAPRPRLPAPPAPRAERSSRASWRTERRSLPRMLLVAGAWRRRAGQRLGQSAGPHLRCCSAAAASSRGRVGRASAPAWPDRPERPASSGSISISPCDGSKWRWPCGQSVPPKGHGSVMP